MIRKCLVCGKRMWLRTTTVIDPGINGIMRFHKSCYMHEAEKESYDEAWIRYLKTVKREVK